MISVHHFYCTVDTFFSYTVYFRIPTAANSTRLHNELKVAAPKSQPAIDSNFLKMFKIDKIKLDKACAKLMRKPH
jgi:hypothetical protein